MAAIPATLEELRVPVDTLHEYPGNPRRGDVATIARSLQRNGQYRPIVVRATTREVLAGNHTLRAARDELGWSEIAATFVDVDDDTAKRIVAVDNRANDLAGYDTAELAALLSSLQDLEGTGYKRSDLESLLARLGDESADADRDTEPMPAPAKPIAKPGDAWELPTPLGAHRLLCGDSTQATDVDRVLAGEAAEMVWTDPPYGLDYHAPRGARKAWRGRETGPSFANDYTDTDQLYDLVRSVLTVALEHTRPGGTIYLAHADMAFTHGGSLFRRATLDAGWDLHQVLVWVKQTFVLSRQDYHWQHEPILYGWKPGAGHRWNGESTEATVLDDDVDVASLDKRQLVALVRALQNERRTTVIREDRPHSNALHPTMKPVALVAHCVRNSSRRGELVLEPFGGSGTTLIACENLARRCAIVEYMPAYCDVIIDRWQRHTGREAQRVGRRRSAGVKAGRR